MMRVGCSNNRERLTWIVLAGLFSVYLIHKAVVRVFERGTYDSTAFEPLWEQNLNFTKLNFNNTTGNPTGSYLVPNYIHFIYFGAKPISYIEMICILAAFKNQNPDKIYFHYNNKTTFTGKYWEVIETTARLKNIISFHEVALPDEIFGQPLSRNWRYFHGSDIVRIQMLMRFGGIFLDNDCYVVKNVDSYRLFEMSVNWDEGQFLGNQVIIAHKDARFLKKWLDCYRVYDGSKWYYNGGERPTTEVLYKHPELVHRVKELFGVHTNFVYFLFQQHWSSWRTLNVLHLLIGHQYLLKSLNEKARFPVEFNETNIAYYPITFREMAYDVYDVANITWPKNKFL